MKTKAKISFIEFLRPDSYWPAPYSIDQAFQVMRWMVATGASLPEMKDERGTWGTSTVANLLNGQPTCVNSYDIGPIRSCEDLRRRFHYALMSHWESLTGADKWPDANMLIAKASPAERRNSLAAVEFEGVRYTLKYEMWRGSYPQVWHITKAEPITAEI